MQVCMNTLYLKLLIFYLNGKFTWSFVCRVNYLTPGYKRAIQSTLYDYKKYMGINLRIRLYFFIHDKLTFPLRAAIFQMLT